MEVTALCFRLLILEIIQLGTQIQKSDAAFLRVTPNRLQHFRSDSVSLECDGFDNSSEFRAIRNTEEFKPACGIKRTPTGTFCTIDNSYPQDSGEYWCETDGGERSNSVNINVTASSVILESPVHPVIEGGDVTLRCRNKENSNNLRADFYKDGVFMQSSPVAEMTINNVSMSDEGLYRCSISDVGTSPESWLAVRAHEENHPILWTVVITLMVSLVLLVVGFLCIGRHSSTVLCSSSKTSAGSDEDNHIGENVCGDDAADDPSVLYAAVVTKKRQDTAGAAAENLSLDTNHRRRQQTQKDEDKFSLQPVYAALKVNVAPQPLQPDHKA